MSEKQDIFDLLSKIDRNKYNTAMSAPSKVVDPVCTVDDIINAPDMLTQLVRYMFVNNGISRSKFREMHRRYCSRCGILSSEASTKFNNNLKPIIEPRRSITWRTFVEDILPALGLRLVDVELSLADDNGGIRKITLTDVRRKISSDFPSDVPKLKDISVTVCDGAGEISTIKRECNNGEDPGLSDDKRT